jgi:acyl-CoA thioesterase I
MRVVPVLALLFVVACGERDNLDGDTSAWQSGDTVQVAPDTSPPTIATDAPTVIFLGTSLTAGYGLTPEQAYPAVVERLAAEQGTSIRSVNAGLSGETSAGALRRIEWVLRTPADIVVIETGANDGLRALDVEATRTNIREIIARIRAAQPTAHIMLVQMEAPPNFGADYTSRFRSMYGAIAEQSGVTLVPFLLDGVAAVPDLNLEDGIHPNAAGAERVAANVWRSLGPAVERVHRGR